MIPMATAPRQFTTPMCGAAATSTTSGFACDLDAASAFYVAIMRHAGLREGRRWEDGLQFRGAWATFSLVDDGAPPTENLHIAFPAPDRQTVEDFHRAATTVGYLDGGSPGERSQLHPGCYAAYVLDPDGTNVESVFRNRS